VLTVHEEDDLLTVTPLNGLATVEKAPERAHTIVLDAQADTADDLARELRFLADRVERGDITVGCIGGSVAGSLYSYRVRAEQTHEVYFQAVAEWLRGRGLPRPIS
jgi:hypothetical protein